MNLLVIAFIVMLLLLGRLILPAIIYVLPAIPPPIMGVAAVVFVVAMCVVSVMVSIRMLDSAEG